MCSATVTWTENFLVFSKGERVEVLRGAGTAATGKAAKGEPSSRGNAGTAGRVQFTIHHQFYSWRKKHNFCSYISETLATVRLLNVVNPINHPIHQTSGVSEGHPRHHRIVNAVCPISKTLLGTVTIALGPPQNLEDHPTDRKWLITIGITCSNPKTNGIIHEMETY